MVLFKAETHLYTSLKRFSPSLNKNSCHTPQLRQKGGLSGRCSPLKWWACSLLAILRFIDPAKYLSIWYLGPQENICIVGTGYVTIQIHCKLRNVQHENNWADTYRLLGVTNSTYIAGGSAHAFGQVWPLKSKHSGRRAPSAKHMKVCNARQGKNSKCL